MHKIKAKVAATPRSHGQPKWLAGSELWSADDDPGFLISDVARQMRFAFDRAIMDTDAGLTRAQWQALVHLFRRDGMSQSELASQLDIERASVGTVIERLETAGLVSRKREARDRRVRRVYVTPKARALIPSLSRKARSLYADMFGDITASDLATFVHVLRLIRDR